MIPKIAAVLAPALLLVGLAAASAPSAAEDRQPCVDKAEFYGARDFGVPVLPDAPDPMTRVPQVQREPVGRLVLEGKWDVRHRGTAVRSTLDGASLGSNPLVRVKMYPSCSAPLSDLQVYVGFHKDTDLVLWTMWWPSRSRS
jgi:hypothetical protein